MQEHPPEQGEILQKNSPLILSCSLVKKVLTASHLLASDKEATFHAKIGKREIWTKLQPRTTCVETLLITIFSPHPGKNGKFRQINDHFPPFLIQCCLW